VGGKREFRATEILGKVPAFRKLYNRVSNGVRKFHGKIIFGI
jgi:hypothetical protein